MSTVGALLIHTFRLRTCHIHHIDSLLIQALVPRKWRRRHDSCDLAFKVGLRCPLDETLIELLGLDRGFRECSDCLGLFDDILWSLLCIEPLIEESIIL